MSSYSGMSSGRKRSQRHQQLIVHIAPRCEHAAIQIDRGEIHPLTREMVSDRGGQGNPGLSFDVAILGEPKAVIDHQSNPLETSRLAHSHHEVVLESR